MVETLDDVIEQLADWIGVYGAHDEQCTPKKMCRCCWTALMRERIERAIEVDRKLAS